MVMTLSVSSTGTTTANIAAATLPANGTLEVQYSVDPDFAFCVAPIVTGITRASPIALTGLNQDATYFVRARGRLSDGSAEAWSNTVGVRTGIATAPSLNSGAVMIQPAMIVVPNRVLSWAAGSGVAGFPVENLAYDAPVAFRSYTASGAHVIEASMAPDAVDTIALLMTNLPEDATVVIKAGANAANVQGASPTFNSGSLAARASANLPGRPGYHALFRLGQVVKQPYWRLEITANSLFGKTLHIEHAIFGWNRATKNHSVDRQESTNDLGEVKRLRSGVPDRTRGLRGRTASFDISMLTEAQDWQNYSDLGYKVGNTDPVLVVPNSKAGTFLHDRILYGTMTVKTSNPASPKYTRSFSIDSILP